KLLHPPDYDRKREVHISYIGHILRGPEPFSDGRQSGPYPRVYSLRSDMLPPHTGLATENQPGLLRAQPVPGRQRIDRVMVFSGLNMIQVVAQRKHSAKPLPGRGGARSLSPPGLDHNVLWQIRMENLIPSDHSLAVLLQNL